MSSVEVNCREIVELFETTSYEVANRYLKTGWFLLGTFSNQYSNNGYAFGYCLGWSSQNGGVTYPEKTEMELRRERLAEDWTVDEELPF